MKNSKQVNLSLSVIESLDRVREQLPRRGSLLASYSNAIEVILFNSSYVQMNENNKRLFAENERLLHENISMKKKVRT